MRTTPLQRRAYRLHVTIARLLGEAMFWAVIATATAPFTAFERPRSNLRALISLLCYRPRCRSRSAAARHGGLAVASSRRSEVIRFSKTCELVRNLLPRLPGLSSMELLPY